MKFNSLIVYFLFFCFPILALSQNNVGTLVTDPIRPFSASSTQPSAIANEIKGGPFTSSNLVGLSNIPVPRLEIGAIGYVTNSGLYYRLTSTSPVTWSSIDGSNITNISVSNVVGALSTNGSATNLTNFPTLNQNTTGTASNVTGVVAITNGGTGATNIALARSNLGSTSVGDALFIAPNAASARTTIGATTVGSSVFTLANPNAIAFLRFNADNTASTLSASDFRTALNLDTASTNPSSAFQASSANLTNLALNNGGSLTNIPVVGVVGALSTNGSAAGLTNFPASLLTTNGNGAGLTNLTAANITGTVGLASNVTGTIAISNGGSGATTVGGARTNLGATTIGNTLFTATNATVGKAALELAPSNNITLNQVDVNKLFVSDGASNGIQFETGEVSANTRINLGIGAGATNTVGFGKIRLGSELIIEESVNDAAIITFPNETDPVVLGSAYWNHGSVRQSLGFSTNLSNFWTSASIASGRTNLGLPLAALTNTNNVNFLAAFFGSNTNPVLVNTNGEVVSPTNFWAVAPISTTVQYQTNVTGTSTNAATNSRNLFLFSLAPSVSGVTNTVTLPTNPATTFEGDRATITHLAQTTNAVTAIRQLGAATNLITLNQLDETVLLMYRSGAWRLADNISYVEPIFFSGTNAAANAAASRTNLGLGNSNVVYFNTLGLGRTEDGYIIEGTSGTSTTNQNDGFRFSQSGIPFFTFSNRPPFGGRLVIHGTNGGIDGGLNVFKTNVGLFEGVINAINSNNTAISNETLFRVGVAEATNKSAQFGFRSTNTNGNGVAVFSVYGYNALMMVGPSDPAAGINPIEAMVYSVSPTNKVMTLIRTNTGATMFHRPIEFENTTNQAVTRTNLGLGQTNSVTFSSLTLSSDLTFGSGDNIVLSTTNGTKIGTATNQLLGFYNQTPIAQPSTTGVTTNGFTQGSGNNIHPNSTFTGGIGTNEYTISDIVAHLKSLGLIAP
jgi:hypothetical protein